MSRRFKLGILLKSKHEKNKNFSVQQLQEKYGNEEGISTSELSQEKFTIGKDFDDSFLKQFSSPAFLKEETNNLVNQDDTFYLISKEGFQALIENYRQRIAAHFKQMLGQAHQIQDKGLEDERFSYIYFRAQEWGNDLGIKPYDLESENLTNSGNLEYAIFDLIRLYKVVDWDKELITISAW